MQDTDPLMHTLNFMRQNNRTLYSHIDELLQHNDFLANDHEELCHQLRGAPPEKTKLRLYLTMNPSLSVHPIYKVKDSEHAIEDNLRMLFTRIRVCSHKLRSETGRWDGTPPDQRLCPHCINNIQDEEHILRCPATHGIRIRFNVTTTNIHELLENPSETDLICLKQCLKLLQSNGRN